MSVVNLMRVVSHDGNRPVTMSVTMRTPITPTFRHHAEPTDRGSSQRPLNSGLFASRDTSPLSSSEDWVAPLGLDQPPMHALENRKARDLADTAHARAAGTRGTPFSGTP